MKITKPTVFNKKDHFTPSKIRQRINQRAFKNEEVFIDKIKKDYRKFEI